MGLVHVDRYVGWIVRHCRLLLGAQLVLLLVCGGVSTRLRLEAGLEALLPTGDPRIAAVKELEQRMGSLSSLVVEIRSPERSVNFAYAQALQEQLEREPLIERAIWRVPELYRFTRRHRWLYAERDLLKRLLERLKSERLQATNPFYVELDESPLPVLRKEVAELQDRWVRLEKDGVFQSRNGDLVAMVVLPQRPPGGVSELAVERAVEQVLQRIPPGAFDSRLSVRFSGELHAAVQERHAIEEDMALTTAIVALLVAGLVGLYFGRVRAIPLMGIPAVTGLAVAMGVAAVAFGELNASTAFLGAIIVGNGINYPILMLARYAEERARGSATRAALVAAVAGTARATALAACAASLAYGSLALTRFRGFSQFGVIGAVGMLASWAATMTTLPAMLWLLDHRHSSHGEQVHRANFGVPFAHAAVRAPRLLIGAGLALALIAVAALPHWLHDPFEYDFRKLRTIHTAVTQSSPELDALFGRALSPSILLTDSPAEARVAAQQIRRQAAERSPSPVALVLTIDDLVPGSEAQQQSKLLLLTQLRQEIDRLPNHHRIQIGDLRPPDDLGVIHLEDLPEIARRPFLERDGTLGRVVLIYPPQQGFSVANGRDLLGLAEVIGDIDIGGRMRHAVGRAVIFAAMIRSIAHDAPIATTASFGAVALLVFALLRGSWQALTILGTLGLGVVWTVGGAALLSIKINFLNFIALPITFGIGIDYGANLYLRYEAEGRGAIARALSSTGGAVALNSATTITGYGSLLLAHNRALRSFGLLAILGEFACLAAALLIIPALFALRDRRVAPV